MRTIVFKYGIHAPHENALFAFDVVGRMYEFRKALTEARNVRRDAERALIDGQPSVAPLLRAAIAAREAYEAAYVEAKRDRVKLGTKKISPEVAARLAPFKRAFVEARDALWKARKAASVGERSTREKVRRLLAKKKDRPTEAQVATLLGVSLAEVRSHRVPEDETRWQRKARSMKERAERVAEAERSGVESMQVRRDRIAQAYNGAVRVAYAEHARADGRRGSLLGSDTAHLVKAAIEQSNSKRKPYDRDGIGPQRMRYPARDVGGRIAVMMPDGGMPIADVLTGKSRRLQLVLPPETAWLSPSRAERRRDRKGALVRLALATDADGGPIWTSFVLDMHRPLPDDAILRRAVVRRRGIGPHSRWELTLTVDTEQDRTVSRSPGGACAVKLECAEMPDGGTLVASWHDERGQSGVELLSPETMRALEMPREIKAGRDLRFDAITKRVVEMADQWAKVPEPAAKLLQNMPRWGATSRMVSFLADLQEYIERRGKRADPAMVATADTIASWAARDRHEWACESRQSERSRARRREQYRVLGARLGSRYDVLVFEDAGLTRERPDKDDERYDSGARLRSLAVLASPGELLASVALTSGSRGCEMRFVKMPPRASAADMMRAYLANPAGASRKRSMGKKTVDDGERSTEEDGANDEELGTARKAVDMAAE